MQDFIPKRSFRSLFKAAFPLGLLNQSGGALIIASQRHGGPDVAHPSPWVCMRRLCGGGGEGGVGGGGISEASACVAAIVYPGTRGWLNNPPVNTATQWETRKWRDPRDLHTLMPFPWSRRIPFLLFERYKEERGGLGVGWGLRVKRGLVSHSSWFLNEYKKEEEGSFENVYGLRHEN